MTWTAAQLVGALKRQVTAMESNLRERVDGSDADARQEGVLEAWRSDYDAAKGAQRTAATWLEWRNDRITQAAVAWVLLTVFARYCEDNALVSPRWIGGADADQRTRALDARDAYFRAHPERTDREWLGQVVDHFGRYTATAALVERASPLHLVAPSGDAANALLNFWWQQGDDGAPRYGFAETDTRFLGDVYQDLSEHAKKTYALLQTPEFVEEFILDQTMEPALADRPLEGFTVIDPTCGSGHFLLGAFARLHRRWLAHAPALGARELVAKALDGVYGVDVNPFAVAIARFRLLVAALQAAGDMSIEERIGYTPHLAAGDSLLWGADQQLLPEDLLAGPVIRADATEDAAALESILQREHDVVVGNPPYITVKDAAKNAMYRSLYQTPHRQYALSVPFMELFFQLAHGSAATRPAGWVGQITSNSFMKREFGLKLIEGYLTRLDLRTVIDTSGAYIPGHGTPTVILIGRHQKPTSDTVRAVLGVRGEPGRPDDAAKGLVWSSIVGHIDHPPYDDQYVTVTDLNVAALRQHPWSLSGGGSVDVLEVVNGAHRVLADRIDVIGRTTHTGLDEAFFIDRSTSSTLRIEEDTVAVILGENVRDYSMSLSAQVETLFPYNAQGKPDSLSSDAAKLLWPNKALLRRRVDFQQTIEERGLRWVDHSMFFPARYSTPLSITFAFVATHNHFVLDRGEKVFNRSAPVIKLPAGASVDDHLRLLGVLNSSVACFWLKQNSYPKGGDPVGQDGARVSAEAWSDRFEFTGTTLKDFPLPGDLPLNRAAELDDLAGRLAAHSPAEVGQRDIHTAATLDNARAETSRLRALMVAQQEELDWQYYRIYGLLEDDLTYPGAVPSVVLGERAFEIALARRMADGEETAWFSRHGSTPITDIPDHFPADYRALLQRRLNAIETNPHIRLLERPEYKRRWASEPWDKQVTAALRDWLLDRVEDFRSVLRLWAGDASTTTGTALTALLSDEAVPYLAALRYKPSGLDKRAAWEETWALQRREDAGEALPSPIPVPPKYKPADFAKTSFWSHRGKLDVPKERFIGYPGAGRDTDTSALLGWAGWDHAEQALALAGVVTARIDDGWAGPQLTPLLAGLHELSPWVRQWHSDIDADYGASPADIIDGELTQRLAEYQLTITDLTSWRPTPTRRGRRAATP